MPISWATNADPQRIEVMIAQMRENVFLSMKLVI
jgi:hypothetical protein